MQDQNTVRICEIAYQVSRRYTGSCPVAALLEQQIVRAALEKPSVDAVSRSAL